MYKIGVVKQGLLFLSLLFVQYAMLMLVVLDRRVILENLPPNRGFLGVSEEELFLVVPAVLLLMLPMLPLLLRLMVLMLRWLRLLLLLEPILMPVISASRVTALADW